MCGILRFIFTDQFNTMASSVESDMEIWLCLEAVNVFLRAKDVYTNLFTTGLDKYVAIVLRV